MKKWTIIITLLLIGGLCFGVTKLKKGESTKEEVYQEFFNKVISISSYECLADVEVIGNKTPTKYKFKHKFNSSNTYIIETILPQELAGNTVEYVGDKIIIKNPKMNDTLELPNEGEMSKNLFIGDFINNFKDSNDLVVEMDEDFLILKTNIKSSSEYFDTQILFVDKKTKTPHKMLILDKKQKERFIVKYSKFEYKK